MLSSDGAAKGNSNIMWALGSTLLVLVVVLHLRAGIIAAWLTMCFLPGLTLDRFLRRPKSVMCIECNVEFNHSCVPSLGIVPEVQGGLCFLESHCEPLLMESSVLQSGHVGRGPGCCRCWVTHPPCALVSELTMSRSSAWHVGEPWYWSELALDWRVSY